MYASWTDRLWRYLASRFPARLFVPCAGFLLLAGSAGGPLDGALGVAFGLGLALMLLLQFRLLDDLADLAHDRRVHPERVLVQAGSRVPFRVFLCLCAAVVVALAASQPGARVRLAVVLLLDAAALAWYGAVRARVASPILRYHMLVVKYPAFVLCLGGHPREGWRLCLAMGTVYLCFAMHEALHDPDLRALPGTAPVLAVETAALSATALLMAIEMAGVGLWRGLVQGGIGLLGTLALGELFLRRRLHLERPACAYAVLLLGFLLVAGFAVGVRP